MRAARPGLPPAREGEGNLPPFFNPPARCRRRADPPAAAGARLAAPWRRCWAASPFRWPSRCRRGSRGSGSSSRTRRRPSAPASIRTAEEGGGKRRPGRPRGGVAVTRRRLRGGRASGVSAGWARARPSRPSRASWGGPVRGGGGAEPGAAPNEAGPRGEGRRYPPGGPGLFFGAGGPGLLAGFSPLRRRLKAGERRAEGAREQPRARRVSRQRRAGRKPPGGCRRRPPA